MKTLFCTLPVLAAALLLASCSTTGTSFVSETRYEQMPGQLRRGVTKQETVRRLLGEPEGRQMNPSGERWLYGSAANRRSLGNAMSEQLVSTGIGFIPYAGGAINSVRSIARAGQSSKPGAWVDFDHRGIVQDYTIELN